jgi:hypothetical protein
MHLVLGGSGQLGTVLRVFASGQHKRRPGVPQIVQPDRWQTFARRFDCEGAGEPLRGAAARRRVDRTPDRDQ